MLETILVTVHVLVCFFLIFVVLLQSGQAADLAGAFGGGGSQTAFGMRGAATLLQKLTTGSAIVFMLTSLSLGIVGRSESSVIDDLGTPAATAPAQQPQTPPATPPAGDAGSGEEAGRGGGRNGGPGDGGQAAPGGGRNGGQDAGQGDGITPGSAPVR